MPVDIPWEEPVNTMSMMQLKIVAVPVIFFGWVQVSEGRLGETEAECLRRYGPSKSDVSARSLAQHSPILRGQPERMWHYQGWNIRAAFGSSGTVARIVYSKANGSKDGRSPYIEDFEFKAILDGNGGAAAWSKHDSRVGLDIQKALTSQLTASLLGATYVRRSDGATVRFKPALLSITLELPEAAQVEAAAKLRRENHARHSVPKF